MHTGACRTGYRLVFGVGRTLVLTIEGVLNAQVGIRTDEDEWSHRVSLQSDRGIQLL
jgi:hypothetical protein